MENFDVRLVTLDPLRVASSYGFGSEPEGQAWAGILSWCQQHISEGELPHHRFFGFNNPSPTPGSPNYGYEQWVTTDPQAQPEGNIQVKDFPGGLYAVTRCTGIPSIPPTWQRLVAWLDDHPFRLGSHQWLEECLTPQAMLGGSEPDIEQMVFDLYMPVVRLTP